MSFISTLLDIMAVVAKSVGYSTATVVALLALASPRSQKARFWLNAAIYIASLGVCSVFGVIASIVMNLIPGQRLNTNFIVARTFYLLCGTLTGIRFQVEGEENFAKARPAVCVGNHQTSIDILYLGRIFPKMASIMAKQELKFAPLLGQFMLLSGAVFINRKNRHDAVKAFNQVGDEMKKNKLSLWVFPEGTRSNLPHPDLLPFKKGAFHLAVQAQVPIVPVVCENYHRLFDGKSRFESGTIRIKVLPPVETKGVTKEGVDEVVNKVRTQMLDALKAMDADRDAFDSSSAATNPTSSLSSTGKPSLSTGSNAPPGLVAEAGLGGVAGWMSKVIGTGSPSSARRGVNRRVAKDEDRLRQAGSTGSDAKDWNLISEGQRKLQGQGQGSEREGGKSTATDLQASSSSSLSASTPALQRNSTSASTNSGSEETDEGSTVLVEKP